MKSKLILFILIINTNISIAQTNLISNGSFENGLAGWTSDDAYYGFICEPGGQTCWLNVNPTYSCINPINHVSVDPATNYFGIQEAADGNKYAAIIAEHSNSNVSNSFHHGMLGFQLTSTLDDEKWYILKFKVSKMDNSVRNPQLEISLNDHFSTPWLMSENISSEKKTNDGSPANNYWEDRGIIFKSDANDVDWIIFKITNDWNTEAAWGGVYLDDIQLFELCDYYSFQSGDNCLIASGTISMRAGPVASNGMVYHWKEPEERFHIVDENHNITHIKIEITVNGSHVKWIEDKGVNGINWWSIYWDGKNDAGAEMAASWYTAEVDAWNGLGKCTHIHKTFTFFKFNNNDEHSLSWAGPHFSSPEPISNGPIIYKPCCVQDMTINNAHFEYYDWQGGDGYTVGEFVFRANGKITFGPDVLSDFGTKIILRAPNIIKLTSNSNIQGQFLATLEPCVLRLKPNIRPFAYEEENIGKEKKNEIFKSYPNPSKTGKFNIEIPTSFNDNTFNIKLYDLLGQEIPILTEITNNKIQVLPLITEIRGMFVYIIQTVDTSINGKIIFE